MLLTTRPRRRALMLMAVLPAWCAAAQAAAPAPAAAPARAVKAEAVRPVDVNTASRAELKTLPGIGDAEADRIVSMRPYLSKAELATKGALPTGTYLSLRRAVEAKPPRPAHR